MFSAVLTYFQKSQSEILFARIKEASSLSNNAEIIKALKFDLGKLRGLKFENMVEYQQIFLETQINWNIIASEVKNRTMEDCQLHWNNYLAPWVNSK